MDVPCRSISVLCHEQFGVHPSGSLCLLGLGVSITMHKDHDVGVLFDGTGFAEVSESWALPRLFSLAVDRACTRNARALHLPLQPMWLSVISLRGESVFRKLPGA